MRLVVSWGLLDSVALPKNAAVCFRGSLLHVTPYKERNYLVITTRQLPSLIRVGLVLRTIVVRFAGSPCLAWAESCPMASAGKLRVAICG